MRYDFDKPASWREGYDAFQDGQLPKQVINNKFIEDHNNWLRGWSQAFKDFYKNFR